MSSRPYAAALFAALTFLPAAPALAVNEIIITHAKALAGDIVPGDTAGYPVQLRTTGNFVLGSNLNPPVGQTAIQVFADNITIDLSGYSLLGTGQSAWYGIVGASGADGATIKNGTIAEFKADGLNGVGEFWRVENLRVVKNGGRGVSGGDRLRVTGSTVSSNESVGIYCGISCHIEGNLITSNLHIGITILTGLVIGNTITDNSNFGIFNSIGNGAGFGHNFLRGNHGGGAQVTTGIFPLSPNACHPACP